MITTPTMTPTFTANRMTTIDTADDGDLLMPPQLPARLSDAAAAAAATSSYSRSVVPHRRQNDDNAAAAANVCNETTTSEESGEEGMRRGHKSREGSDQHIPLKSKTTEISVHIKVQGQRKVKSCKAIIPPANECKKFSFKIEKFIQINNLNLEVKEVFDYLFNHPSHHPLVEGPGFSLTVDAPYGVNCKLNILSPPDDASIIRTNCLLIRLALMT